MKKKIEMNKNMKEIFQLNTLNYVYSDGYSFKVEIPVFGGYSRLRKPNKKEHQEILEFLEKIDKIKKIIKK